MEEIRIMSAAVTLVVLLVSSCQLLVIGQTTHSPATTTTTTTTATPSCANYHACMNNATCWSCLNPLVHHSLDLPSLVVTQHQHVQKAFFFSLLNMSACNESGSLVTGALYDMWWNSCGSNDTAVSECLYAEAQCRYEPDCADCLVHIWETPDNASHLAIDTVACNRSLATLTDATILREVVDWCYIPGACTLSKQLCSSNTSCAAGLSELRNGNGGMAVAVTGAFTSVAGSLLSAVVYNCLYDNTVACQYWGAVCDSDPTGYCGRCMQAMSYGADSTSIASGRLSSSCEALFTLAGDNGTGYNALLNYINTCPEITWCSSAVYDCVMDPYVGPDCAQCVLKASTNTSWCDELLSPRYYDVSGSCSPCPESVYINNRVVVATSIVGGLSILPCLAVILVIVAYGNDRIFMRDRITIGIMASNAVYSIANTIPLDLLETSEAFCGRNANSFQTQQFARSLWFGAKYALVGFEAFILFASIYSLKRGVRTLDWRIESSLHIASALCGIVAFTVYFVRYGEIRRAGFNSATQTEMQQDSFSYLQLDDDLDDVYHPEIEADSRFASADSEYDRFKSTMLRAWICLLGIVMAMWIYLRWLFFKIVREWQEHLKIKEDEWNRDLWAPSQQAERENKLRVLLMAREAHEEVAKPLEPYVFVFVLFCVPAAVMATDYCVEHSHARAAWNSPADQSGANLTSANNGNHFISNGLCDVTCEMILAFRTIATIVAYFAWREHRVNAFDVRAVVRKLRSRFCNCACFGSDRKGGVKFASYEHINEVFMIPRNDDQHTDSDDDGREMLDSQLETDTVGDSVPYEEWTDSKS